MSATPDAPLALLLSDDLIFTSRITGTARAEGVAMKTARSTDVLLTIIRQQTPQGIIIDLANPGLAIADLIAALQQECTPLPYVVAYGSHVDAASLKRARDAGCDLVLPRSKFVEDLPGKLRKWVEPQQRPA
jgi:CheY-like chemotaxis protein